ncbi:MAG: nucleotide pyrophosphohydrolase [Candidatus Heimdallarchaeaceae archaeon]
MASLKELTEAIMNFRDQRNWQPFHTPKNLVMSLIIELGELCELFQWTLTEEEMQQIKVEKKEELAEELADVAIYLLMLAHELNVDLEKAIPSKLEKNALKYPVSD